MKRWGIIVGALATMAVACTSNQPGWQVGSKTVDRQVVSTFVGPSHCQMEASVFLVMGWPLGTKENNIDAARWYVRNPPEFMKPDLLADFSSSVTTPKDARYTDYHNATFELWFAPSDQDVAAYIKTEGHFERWPRARHSFTCL
jgi:hypothetical protein